MPKVEYGNIELFFDRLDKVKDNLMLELHRGVFTTHGSLKLAFRALEHALQVLEAAHVARELGPIDRPLLEARKLFTVPRLYPRQLHLRGLR